MADPPSQTSDQPQVQMRGLDSFCVELLTGIFLCLPYRSLLSVLAVCTEWKNIVMEDPSLSVEIFKRPGEKYVDSGCREKSKYGYEDKVHDAWDELYKSYTRDSKYVTFRESTLEPSEDRLLAAWHQANQNPTVAKVLLRSRSLSLPERVRLHPAIPKISYIFGCDMENVRFYVEDRSKDCPEGYRHVKLSKLGIANDFICIPAVTNAIINVRRAFVVILENRKGITLTDLFNEFVKQSTREIALDPNDPMFDMVENVADLLGDHRYYEGLDTVVRNGNCLTAEVWLGS